MDVNAGRSWQTQFVTEAWREAVLLGLRFTRDSIHSLRFDVLNITVAFFFFLKAHLCCQNSSKAFRSTTKNQTQEGTTIIWKHSVPCISIEDITGLNEHLNQRLLCIATVSKAVLSPHDIIWIGSAQNTIPYISLQSSLPLFGNLISSIHRIL